MALPASRAREGDRTTRLEHTVEIGRPVEAVFATVVDPRNDHRWCPRAGHARQVAATGPVPGARYELEHQPTLRRRHIRHIELVEVVPSQLVLSVQEDEVARFLIRYELDATATGTRLRQSDEIDWRLPWYGKPFARTIVGWHIGAQLRSLKRLLEDPNATHNQGPPCR